MNEIEEESLAFEQKRLLDLKHQRQDELNETEVSDLDEEIEYWEDL